ncbi:uncharacterized protein BN534_01518 [Eggerthella sp. CAG:209]|nr:uncharacterized protein BN534_01518 [Eggerthella sp. CAG:209]
MSADAYVNGIEVALEVGYCNVLANGNAQLNLYTQRGDVLDFGVEQGFGQAIVGDAVAEHATELGALLVYRYGMTHAGEVIRCGKTARTTTDNGNLLAGGFCHRSGAVGRFVIAGVALQATDIDSGINEAATAGVFAGMLANIGASTWEGVVFADELNGVVETTSFNQCDVARDIDICGAALNAGNRVVGRAQAAAFCVELVVFAESAYSGKGHFGSLGTDCAICRNAHVFSECLDSRKVGFGCRSFQHAVEQRFDLRQADAAGNALAACLRAAQGDKAARHINGTGTLRMRNKTTGHILTYAAHGLLRFARGADFQWAHGILLGLYG